MALRFAFAGFRHGHIHDLYRRANEMAGVEVVAACEEDEEAREAAAGRDVEVTHSDLGEMLSGARCDVVAIGDYFARRGSVAIQALSEGKHVIVDKPLCTDLAELEEIERLSQEKGLKVGCMLTMRGSAPMIGVRELLREETIGEVHAIAFGGQHPLNLNSRAGWYFEPGKHGGTITDIAIHAVDCIPWMTGLRFSVVNAARCWNAFAPEHPDFEDGAQMMLTMDNGCGVLGDVSYFLPDRAGYRLPWYWRMTFFGRKGILETSATMDEIQVAMNDAQEVVSRPLPEGNSGAYLDAFLSDIRGETRADALDTDAVIRASRDVLTIQKAADEGAHDVALG